MAIAGGGFYTALTPEGARSVHSGSIIAVTDANFQLAWAQLVPPFAPGAAGGG